MPASAAPFPPPTRWSRTLAHTLLACAASLALHALALGGLAWLYHRSLALGPPPAEVRIAAVYLAPVASQKETLAAAAPPEAVSAQPATREVAAAEVWTAKAEAAARPAPRVVDAPRPEPAATKSVEAPAGPHPALPPRAGEGAEQVVGERSTRDTTLPLPPPAGEGRDAGRQKNATRTHAGIEWRVQDWLAQHRHYPRAARRSGAEGTVWVRFVLDRGGDLQGSEILESSGHAVLDRAALDLLEKASPFPALPPELTTDEIELVLPIEYDLTHARRG